MRTFGILLLLLACVAFRPAGSHKQDDSQQGPAINAVYVRSPQALTVSRHTRSLVSNLFTIVERIIWDILLIPIRIVEFVFFVIRQIEVAIRTVVDLFLYPVRRIFGGIIRIRRERPLNLLENIFRTLFFGIFHPFRFIEEVIDRTWISIRNEINKIAQDALRLTWRFLSTTGLPWLHRALNQVAKLPNLPPFVRAFITDFNTVYNILQIFGYVSRAY